MPIRTPSRGSFLVLSVLLSLWEAGCSIERCERGEPGCYAGPPFADGSCRRGLVAQLGRCVRPQDLIDGGESVGELRDGGLLCLDGGCIAVCEEPERLPRSGPFLEPAGCGGDRIGDARVPATFDAACKGECINLCLRRAWFCGEPCEVSRCDASGVQESCRDRCQGSDNPLTCMQSACNDARGLGCSPSDPLLCGGKAPQCEDVLCANSCANAVFDGVCDDGDTFSAQTGSCAWGSDCADCGPRKRSESGGAQRLGGLCAFHEQCPDFSSSDFAVSRALCAPIYPGSEVTRCLADCSVPGRVCAPGNSCVAVMRRGSSTPLTDANGAVGKACVPLACDDAP